MFAYSAEAAPKPVKVMTYNIRRSWLEKRFPQYAFSGCGRDADRASGEASPVAYLKERFVAVTNGTFWLSTTPDEPGSMSWGAKYPRVIHRSAF